MINVRSRLPDSKLVNTTTRASGFDLPFVPSNQGKALLAISGALIWPGVGHFLVGSTYLGLVWFTAGIGLVLGFFSILANPDRLPMLAIIMPVALLVSIIQLIDAFRCSRKDEPGICAQPFARFTLAAALMIGALYGQHRALTYLQNHVYEICYTPTPSMAPLLAEGDRFVTLKNVPIHRWDVVGFDAAHAFPGLTNDALMKRVVGLPGETIEVIDKGILINGKPAEIPGEAGPFLPTDHWQQPLSRPSRKFAANGCWGRPITLGPDEYFLLGDNSLESLDARYWPPVSGHQAGAMPREEITCKVVAICWPPARARMFR